MKLVKAEMRKETITIELSFDELMVITDMIADSSENYEYDDLYDTLLSEFTKLSTDVLIFVNALRKVGIKNDFSKHIQEKLIEV